MASCSSGGHVARFGLDLGLHQRGGVDDVEAFALDDLQRDGVFAVKARGAGAILEGQADIGDDRPA